MAKFNIAITVGLEGPGAAAARAELRRIGDQATRTATSVEGLQRHVSRAAQMMSAALIAAGVVKSLKAIYDNVAEADAAMAQLRAGVISTGGAAGFSAEQIAVLAGELQRLSGISDETIMGAQGILLTFTKISGEAFPRATQAALDLSARLGTDLTSAAMLVGKALNDPIKGVTALSRAGVQFTAAQKETIRSLVETGRLAEAQGIIFTELETQVAGSAAAFRDTLPGAFAATSNEWSDLLENIGKSGGVGDLLRADVEVAVKALSYLNDHFYRFEASFILGLANVYKAWAGATDFFLAGVELWANGYVRLQRMIPNFLPGAKGLEDAAKTAAFGFGEMRDKVIRVGNDIDMYLGKKARDAIAAGIAPAKGLDEALGGLGDTTGELSGDAKKLAEELAGLVAELKRSAAQSLELADAYGLGDEHVEAIKRAHKLHEEYLKDVAKYGAAAAQALRPLRLEQEVTKELLEDTERAWAGLARASQQAGERFRDKFVDEVKRGIKEMEDGAWEMVRALQGGVQQMEDDARRSIAELRQREDERLDILGATVLYTEGPYKAALFDAQRWFDDAVRAIRKAVATGTITPEEGEDAIAAREGELGRRRADIQRSANEQMLSDASSFFGYMAGEFGGFFKYLADLTQALQQARQAGDALGGLMKGMGASDQAAAAAGAAVPFIAVMKMAYDEFKRHAESRKARKYDRGVLAGMEGGQWLNYGSTGLVEEGAELSRQFRAAAEAFAEAIGGTIRSFAELEIQIRRDGKYFQAFVEGELVGKFESIEAATDAALRAAFAHPETMLSGLSDLVRQGMAQFGKQLTFDEVAEALPKLREIAELSWSDGARSAAAVVRHLDDLRQALGQLSEVTPAVVQGYTDLLAAEVRTWQAWADSISGREKTRAELLAEKEAEKKLFGAQKALRIAELKLLKLDLEAQLKGVQAHGGIVRAGREIDRIEIEGRRAYLQARAVLAKAEIEMMAEVNAAIAAQIVAIAEIITLLEGMTIGDIKLPGGGKGGAGDQKKQDRETLEDMFHQQALAAMDDYARGLEEIKDQWKDAIPLAHGNKELLDKINKARAEEIRLLGEQAKRDMISPYLGGGSAQQTEFDELMRQYDDLRKNYKDLGLALWQVNQAEKNRLQLLGLEAAASLGDPIAAAILQFKGMAETVAFIGKNLEALSFSAEDFARIVGDMQARTFLGLADDMAKYIEDEALRAELAEMRYDIEKAGMLTQIELAKAFGAITEEQHNRLKEIWGLMPADLPVGGAGGGEKHYRDWWGEQVTETTNELERLKEAFGDAKDGIRRFLLDISTNQFGGINSLEALRAAQAEWIRVSEMAAAGKLEGFQGVPEAGRGLLEALKAYSPALFAVELPKIQDILRTLGAADTVTQDNLTYTERFVEQQRLTNGHLDRGFTDLSSHAMRSNATQVEMLDEFRAARAETAALNSKLERIVAQAGGQKVVGR